MARVMQFWRGPCGGTVDFPNFLKKSGVPEPDWAELLGVVRGAKREANNPLLPCAVFFSYAFFLGPAFLGALSRRWRRVCTKAEEEFNQKYSEKIGYQVLIDFDHGKLVFHPPVAAAEHSLFAPKTEEKYDSRVMPAPLPNFLNSAGVSVSDWDDMAGAYADFANSIASVIRCSIFLYAYGAIYLFLRLICIAGGFNKKVQEFKDKYEEKTGWQMTFDTLRTQLLLHAPAVDDSGPEPEVDPPRDEECPESPKSPQSPPMKQAEPVVAVLVSPPREGRQRDPEDPKSPKEAESNEGVEPSNMPSNMPEVVSSI
ncbi:unnamed protein product [Symbiodinium natans]|uniref:Uncharacterized protein n=1 Tax=Symbiodinium natans TaxID=878477 RepID=A0A812T3H8_9DINO|nr:unnamed protein product [Symbiodinium natans]